MAKATGWCFTSFDEKRPNFLSEAMIFIGGQLEQCPKTGTLHWQCILETLEAMRFPQVQKLLKEAGCRKPPHIEKRRATFAKAAEYCAKDRTAIPGTRFADGKAPPGQGDRTDWKEAVDAVLETGRLMSAGPSAVGKWSKGLGAVRSTFRSRKSDCELHLLSTQAEWEAATNDLESDETYYYDKDTKWDDYDGEEHIIMDDWAGEEMVKLEAISKGRRPMLKARWNNVPCGAAHIYLRPRGDFAGWRRVSRLLRTGSNPSGGVAPRRPSGSPPGVGVPPVSLRSTPANRT